MRAKDILFATVIAIVILSIIIYLLAYWAKWSLNNPKSAYAAPAYGTDFYKYATFWVTYYYARATA